MATDTFLTQALVEIIAPYSGVQVASVWTDAFVTQGVVEVVGAFSGTPIVAPFTMVLMTQALVEVVLPISGTLLVTPSAGSTSTRGRNLGFSGSHTTRRWIRSWPT